jgi:hypothetical protein
MKSKDQPRDDLPERFASLEEVAEFWDTHDSAAYAEHLVPVEVDADFRRRHFEIEVDEDVVHALTERASSEHVPANRLANDLLKRELVHI